MKRSEFSHAALHQFGAQADVLLRDLIIPALGNRSAGEALAIGVEPRRVWDALCDAMDVPVAERVAVRLPQPRR